MHKPLKISIITVCFNSANTIRETLQSVASQEYPHVEYILIDGGSKDGTQNIIESFRSHIKTVVSEPDKGIYDAMNKGIQLATGDVIGLLNADDLYAHSAVLTQVANAFEDNHLDACYADLIYFATHSPETVLRYWRSNSFQPGLFAKGWCPAHPTFFVRRRVYEQHGVFDIHLKGGNDVELMMRFLEKHRITTRYLPQVMVKMRLGGVSNNSIKGIIRQNQQILQAAKKLDIAISPWSFFFHKVLSRLNQWTRKPKREALHVK
ncbi:glycosyltransferase [Candidatus Berkiella aquae]|uniref:Glycosyltransferase n=1 Tax=Candidatus Berkiella aquae TaxID=295108 RepID=A0A0Q9YSB3_9GAMM|nr:glycosyltransferase family 2 protein [Candidatus Berkiella aquae]MCS5712287.1 glycosyltransferase [Candidatus Berkiella aquae]